MIVKSLSRKSNGSQLVRYVLGYVVAKGKSSPKANELKRSKTTILLRHNLRSRSIEGYIREFKENESFRLRRRNDSVIAHHTILSLSNLDKEKITEGMLKEISKKYVELRGANNLHLAVKHADKDHIHIHIVTSGVQLNGRSSRISKQQFKSLKLSLDAFQKEKFPQLTNSLPQHGKGARLSKEALIKSIKETRQTTKQSLVQTLEKIHENSLSKDHFVTQLKALGYSTYTRNDRLQGVKIGEVKYRFSRLGFDEKRLSSFDHVKAKENAHIKELEDIRKSRGKESKREFKPVLDEKDTLKDADNIGQKTLFDLQELRESKNTREKERVDDERHQSNDQDDLDSVNIDEEEEEIERS